MCLWCCWFRSEERHTVVEEENCSVDVVVAPHMTVTMFWFSEKKKKKQKKQTWRRLSRFHFYCVSVMTSLSFVPSFLFVKMFIFTTASVTLLLVKEEWKWEGWKLKKHEPTQKQENGKSEALCDYSIVRTQNRNRNQNQTPGFLSQTLITDYYIPKNWIK